MFMKFQFAESFPDEITAEWASPRFHEAPCSRRNIVPFRSESQERFLRLSSSSGYAAYQPSDAAPGEKELMA